MASSVPFGDIHEGQSVERVGPAAQTTHIEATYRIVGADYFRALNLSMIRGREFTASEEDSPTAPATAIIDERLARRLFGTEDPIGQLVRFAEQTGVTQHDRAPMDDRRSGGADPRRAVRSRGRSGDLRAVGSELPRAA